MLRIARLLAIALYLLPATGVAQRSFTADSELQYATKRDSSAPLAELMKELRPIADTILKGQDFDRQLEASDVFLDRMLAILSREDSYDFAFDSLYTVSRIFPEDQSFRLFTWIRRDPSGNYKHFGVVQRRVATGRGGDDFRVVAIPLNDLVDRTEDVQRKVLTPDDWLGALYYAPRNSDYGVLSYDGQVYQVNGLTGKVKKEQVRYYVLLGLNLHNNLTNYKIIDVITFNKNDPTQVRFGAPIFHFSRVPVARVVFKYNDKVPFNLNLGEVLVKKNKTEKMLVFDHVNQDMVRQSEELYEYGVDGRMDALRWFPKAGFDRRKGFFGFIRDVVMYDSEMDKYDPEEVRERARRAREAQREGGVLFRANSEGSKGRENR